MRFLIFATSRNLQPPWKQSNCVSDGPFDMTSNIFAQRYMMIHYQSIAVILLMFISYGDKNLGHCWALSPRVLNKIESSELWRGNKNLSILSLILFQNHLRVDFQGPKVATFLPFLDFHVSQTQSTRLNHSGKFKKIIIFVFRKLDLGPWCQYQ